MIMETGGLQVGIVGTEGRTMIAVAQNYLQAVEIRNFAINMNEVLFVSIDDNKYPGNYITEEEAKKNDIKMPEKPYDEL